MPRKCLTILCFFVFLSSFAGAKSYIIHQKIPHTNGVIAVLDDDGGLYLRAYPKRGEATTDFSRRFTDSPEPWRKILRYNGARRLLYGHSYYIPLDWLTNAWKAEVYDTLFPNDKSIPQGWEHYVRYTQRNGLPESLWLISHWFTGSPDNIKAIMKANGLRRTTIYPGQKLIIPSILLRSYLKPVMLDTKHDVLEFAKDTKGEYGIYKLKKGEALYSAVVVRFTGLTEPEEVKSLAMDIAEDSGITDVTDIAIGYPIKVRTEYLLPEYLYPEHPKHKEWLAHQNQVAGYQTDYRTSNLAGMLVIIDPGHGGLDPGAKNHVICEDEYVYDIAVRVKKVLESETKADTFLLLKDKSSGFKPIDKKKLPLDSDEYLQTRPLYRPTDSVVAANLRCFLTNYLFKQFVKKKGSTKDQVVFLSLHAECMHYSTNGTMVYYPDTRYTRSSWSKPKNSVYGNYHEVKSVGYSMSFSQEERKRSEGISRKFADSFVKKLHQKKVPVYDQKPVRGVIKKSWRNIYVPAVLKYNPVPLKVLVEVANINNATDRGNLASPKFRQKYAEILVESLKDYFSGSSAQVAGLKR